VIVCLAITLRAPRYVLGANSLCSGMEVRLLQPLTHHPILWRTIHAAFVVMNVILTVIVALISNMYSLLILSFCVVAYAQYPPGCTPTPGSTPVYDVCAAGTFNYSLVNSTGVLAQFLQTIATNTEPEIVSN